MRFLRLLPLLLLAGCADLPASPSKSVNAPVALGSAFDAASAGSISGQVTWAGPIPQVEPYLFSPTQKLEDMLVIRSPHEPRVDAKSRGLANAVVFLRGIRPEASKPWDLPATSIELRDRGIGVRQGPGDLHRAGFVRRGSMLKMESKEAAFHNLRARGAAFFSIAFPQADQPLTRTLSEPGLVHLTSGAGYYWASAYLFVDDHPYYTRTDAEGRFTLTDIPPGPLEVVAWHPNYRATNLIRDPESSAYIRQTYLPPLQSSVKVEVPRQRNATVELALRAD